MFRRDYLKKPAWIKVKIPSGDSFKEIHDLLKKYNLSTVCQEARCPNITECWNRKSATIMILGNICTRSCRFCAVKTGNPKGYIDPDEPHNVSAVIKILGLRYVVITSVDRDDLPDLGSGHYAQTIIAIKSRNQETKTEVLIPDFSASTELLKKIIDARPYVIGHNIETVERLTPYVRDRRCRYEKSLSVLGKIKKLDNTIYLKSGFMLGLGEMHEEIIKTLRDLKAAGVDMITVGQYLQPTKRNIPVQRYYMPEEFEAFKKIGEKLGIRSVVSGPLVRSSYRAGEIVESRK